VRRYQLSSIEIFRLLKNDGWYLHRISKSSHHHFKHPRKKGLVTVPHPKKDLPKGTAKNILKQAGIEL